MRLKELRKKNNLTQLEIANFLNIAQTTYTGYELNKSEPTIETLIKLADFYHVSLDYICEHEIKTNNLKQNYINTIYELTDKEVKIILGIINYIKEIKQG